MNERSLKIYHIAMSFLKGPPVIKKWGRPPMALWGALGPPLSLGESPTDPPTPPGHPLGVPRPHQSPHDLPTVTEDPQVVTGVYTLQYKHYHRLPHFNTTADA